jgi:hypothetical protein
MKDFKKTYNIDLNISLVYANIQFFFFILVFVSNFCLDFIPTISEAIIFCLGRYDVSFFFLKLQLEIQLAYMMCHF